MDQGRNLSIPGTRLDCSTVPYTAKRQIRSAVHGTPEQARWSGQGSGRGRVVHLVWSTCVRVRMYVRARVRMYVDMYAHK
eukprot:7919277-Alexandrium_andersonii.AAC.1